MLEANVQKRRMQSILLCHDSLSAFSANKMAVGNNDNPPGATHTLAPLTMQCMM